MEGLTGGQINESINNIFRSANSQQKKKSKKQPFTQSTTDNSTVMKPRRKINTNGKENMHSNNY